MFLLLVGQPSCICPIVLSPLPQGDQAVPQQAPYLIAAGKQARLGSTHGPLPVCDKNSYKEKATTDHTDKSTDTAKEVFDPSSSVLIRAIRSHPSSRLTSVVLVIRRRAEMQGFAHLPDRSSQRVLCLAIAFLQRVAGRIFRHADCGRRLCAAGGNRAAS